MAIHQFTTRVATTRKSRRLCLSLSGLGIALVCLGRTPHIPILIYNPSPSAPLGYYVTQPNQSLKRGEWVLLQAPDRARALADSRGYLPATVPMIKAVAALGGDRVCAVDRTIFINGAAAATRLRSDHRGRELPQWSGCQTLRADEVFVLNRKAPSSFDGRYFGIVSLKSVRARLVKL
jgi:conjugative transfer signal peptidase TraF